VVRLAQVGVVPAGLREERAELGEGQRAGERDDTASQPCAQHQGRRVEALGDDVRVDEDAGTDDAADDHHRGIESAQLTAKRHGNSGL